MLLGTTGRIGVIARVSPAPTSGAMAAGRRAWRSALPASGALVVAGALPWVLAAIPGFPVNYALYLLTQAMIFALVALGLNLLTGYAGQFSIGHAGFIAIGAYTSAILTQRYHVPFVLALAAAGALSAVTGFLLGLPALRLSGPYLAVATLGFGVAVPQLILAGGAFTGGSSGLQRLPPAALPIWYDATVGLYNVVIVSDRAYYYLTLGVLVVLTLFALNVVRGHTGRAFVAIRDSELAAQAMGVSLLRYKTMAFAISAGYAGIAGGLLAHLVRGVSPEEFTIFLSVSVLTMIVVGGLGSIAGSLLGALALTLVQPVLSRLPLLSDFKNLYIIVFGLVLILAVIFLPQGIAGALRGRGFRVPAAATGARDMGEPAPVVDLDPTLDDPGRDEAVTTAAAGERSE